MISPMIDLKSNPSSFSGVPFIEVSLWGIVSVCLSWAPFSSRMYMYSRVWLCLAPFLSCADECVCKLEKFTFIIIFSGSRSSESGTGSALTIPLAAGVHCARRRLDWWVVFHSRHTFLPRPTPPNTCRYFLAILIFKKQKESWSVALRRGMKIKKRSRHRKRKCSVYFQLKKNLLYF